MSREHKINTGYDLASGLFEKHNGNLDGMIGLAGGRETPWLEFKADPFCRSHENGERQEDYSWHILKAVIAFANTCGGGILIGVDDNGQSVPLRDKDSDEVTDNPDKYLRDLDAVLFSRDQFTVRSENIKNPNRVKIEIDNKRCRDLAEMKTGKLGGQTVIVLLVRETGLGENPLLYKADRNEIMLVRDLKDEKGKNRPLAMLEMLNHMKNRPEIQPLREYYSSIPNPNDCFVGRLDELEELHRLLSEIPPRIPLIHGPGGTGKTELAFRYAETFGEEYEACIYLRAENISSIPEGFGQMLLDPQLAAKYSLEIPENVIRTEDRFRIIRDNLLQNSKGDILILFDNLENQGVLNPSEIRKYLTVPGGEKLHIYATTRRDDLQVTGNDTVHPFELKGLQKSEGVELLEKKRPCGSEAERKAAQELVEYLDGNAWALDLIGEDLKQRHPKYDDDYRDWLERIKKEPVKAISEAGEQETVRIKHGCLDPVKLLEPTLKRLKPIARSFANTAALCHPDFIYTGWLKGVYLWKTKEEISARQFNSAIMELQDAHVFNQRAEELHDAPVFSSGQERFEVLKLHRLTRSVLRTQLGENLKKELLVFRKYFLRELLNVLHAGNQEYAGIAVSLPKAGAGLACAGAAVGISAAGLVPVIGSVIGTAFGLALGKAIGLGVFETKSEDSHHEEIVSKKQKFAMAGSLAGSFFGPVGGLLGGAIGGAIDFYSSQTKSSAGEEKEKTMAPDRKTEDLQSRIDQIKEEISPSPEWMQTVRLFLFSFEEIRNDLDAEDIQCVREFLSVCCDKLSRLEVFSELHDRELEILGVELLFRLYPVVTETLKDPESEELYLGTAATLYNHLTNDVLLNNGNINKLIRLENCLKFFIEQVQKWPEDWRLKLDRKLEEMSLATGKRFKPLSEVHFPDPVFCEKI